MCSAHDMILLSLHFCACDLAICPMGYIVYYYLLLANWHNACTMYQHNKYWPLAGLFPLFFLLQAPRVHCSHMASHVTPTSLLLLYSRGCDMQPPGGHSWDHGERGEAVPLFRWNCNQPDPGPWGRRGATPEVILPAHHTLGVHLSLGYIHYIRWYIFWFIV